MLNAGIAKAFAARRYYLHNIRTVYAKGRIALNRISHHMYVQFGTWLGKIQRLV